MSPCASRRLQTARTPRRWRNQSGRQLNQRVNGGLWKASALKEIQNKPIK